MQRFDRYVLRVFLLHWLVVGAAFVLLFTVMEVLGKSDEIPLAQEKFGLGWGAAARYYALNMPFLLQQFAPYITVLSGLGSVLHLLRNREWTPVLTAGRPTWRAFLPMFFAAGAIGFGLLYVREAWAPELLAKREALHRPFFSQTDWRPADLWARGEGDRRLYARHYLPPAATGEAAVIEGLEVYRAVPPAGDEILTASRATWDGTAWALEDGLLRLPSGDEEPTDRLQAAGLSPHACGNLDLFIHGQIDGPLAVTHR